MTDPEPRTRHHTTMRRFGSIEPKGGGVVLPAFHPAVRGGRSAFASRVFAPDELPRVLKSGHHSRKIGAMVTKGPRAGQPIFTLTLEERASCPRSCREWQHCYGNNMQVADRIEHGPALERALARELRELAHRYPSGFLVRLHVLGDFYSEGYVDFWRTMMDELPMLGAFGFTAHDPAGPIGRAIALLGVDAGWSRFAIRFSGAPHEHHAARVIAAGERDADGILCPAQTGATDCCGTCGLCWHSQRSIVFRRH